MLINFLSRTYSAWPTFIIQRLLDYHPKKSKRSLHNNNHISSAWCPSPRKQNQLDLDPVSTKEANQPIQRTFKHRRRQHFHSPQRSLHLRGDRRIPRPISIQTTTLKKWIQPGGRTHNHTHIHIYTHMHTHQRIYFYLIITSRRKERRTWLAGNNKLITAVYGCFVFAYFLADGWYAAFVALTLRGHVFSRRPPPFARRLCFEELKSVTASESSPAAAAVECQSIR